MDTFTWRGQSIKDWPHWLVFKNYARTGNTLIIHQMEGILTFELGDTLHKGPDGFMTCVKPRLPVDGRQSRELVF